jgi:hypothetical protein
MEPSDPGFDPIGALRGLPMLDLDPRRAREIRDHALATMAWRRRRGERWVGLPAAAYERFLEPILVCGLSFGFAAWVLARSIGVLQQARGGFFWQ